MPILPPSVTLGDVSAVSRGVSVAGVAFGVSGGGNRDVVNVVGRKMTVAETYKWTPAEIVIVTAEDKEGRKKQKVVAETCNGLAVHTEVVFAMRLSVGFVVTHVRSGLRIAGDFVSRDAAKRYARGIFLLADWSKTAASLTKGEAGKKRKEAIGKVRKKYRGVL